PRRCSRPASPLAQPVVTSAPSTPRCTSTAGSAPTRADAAPTPAATCSPPSDPPGAVGAETRATVHTDEAGGADRRLLTLMGDRDFASLDEIPGHRPHLGHLVAPRLTTDHPGDVARADGAAVALAQQRTHGRERSRGDRVRRRLLPPRVSPFAERNLRVLHAGPGASDRVGVTRTHRSARRHQLVDELLDRKSTRLN